MKLSLLLACAGLVAVAACSSTSGSSGESDDETSDGGASVSVPPSSTGSTTSGSNSSGTSGGTSSGSPSDPPSNHDDESDGGDGGKTKPPPADCKTVSFKTVLAGIGQAGCGSVTCHGTRLGNPPRIETADAELTYNSFVAYKLGGKAYVKPQSTDPNDSAMHCHFHAQCGAKMPPGGGTIPAELVTAVDAWLACGAPK